jgi:hypothetical protein
VFVDGYAHVQCEGLRDESAADIPECELSNYGGLNSLSS